MRKNLLTLCVAVACSMLAGCAGQNAPITLDGTAADARAVAERGSAEHAAFCADRRAFAKNNEYVNGVLTVGKGLLLGIGAVGLAPVGLVQAIVGGAEAGENIVSSVKRDDLDHACGITGAASHLSPG